MVRVIYDCLASYVILFDETALRIKFFGLRRSDLPPVSVTPSRCQFRLIGCFSSKEIRFYLQDVLIEVGRLETGHGDVEICLHDGSDVTSIDTVVEGLDVVVM